MSRKTILVVDDEPAIIASLAYCLDQEGFQVILAPSGEEALNQVLKQVPDLIISDIMMPGIDGYEFCRRIREYYKTRQIPFLFLSAKSTVESKVRGMKMGGDDYITKPFELDELVLKVRRILERKTTASNKDR